MTAPAIPMTWGDKLDYKIGKSGGMPRIAQRLAEIWGPQADSRATLDKLRTVQDAASLTERERWRAYQVLVIIGEDPRKWGIKINSLGVPPSLVAHFHGELSPTPGPEPQKIPRNRRSVRDTPSYLARYATISSGQSVETRPDRSVGALRATAA